MIDPYATEAKLLAISSPCGNLENDPRFLRRVEQARKSLRAGGGVRIEDLAPLGAVRETEGG